MSTEKENNLAVRRVCRILNVLAGHSTIGLPNNQIAAAIGANDPSTIRLLQTLQEEKLVVQYDSKNWALSMLMMQIAQATASEIDRNMLRQKELSQRIQAGAHSINSNSR